MENQPKISTTSDTLCELHKCGTCLEINKKLKENIKTHSKTKLCFIRKRLTFGRTNEQEKGMNRHQKNL
jgi:hypothetical protein